MTKTVWQVVSQARRHHRKVYCCDSGREGVHDEVTIYSYLEECE